jgi:hypothetical protein
MTDTTRELIQLLADALTNAIRVIHNEDGTQHVSTATAVLTEARAYLAQPEPEEPTDEELNTMLYYEFTTSTGHGERSDPIGFARAVLARWGK